VERSVHLAIRDALDLARLRGGSLVRVMLHGHSDAAAIARELLDELGLAHVEVDVESHDGALRLGFIEVAPHPRP